MSKYNILIISDRYVMPLQFETKEEMHVVWTSITIKSNKNTYKPKDSKSIPLLYMLIDPDSAQVEKHEAPVLKLVKKTKQRGRPVGSSKKGK